MCMCADEYLCYECEEFVKGEVKDLLHKYKDEILDSCDWWWGLDKFSINVFCQEDEPFEPDARFEINVYKVGENGMDDYSIQWDLPSLTRQQLRIL